MDRLEKIKDPKIRTLATRLYDSLILTKRVSLFEVEVNDFYIQIGEEESFKFSVDFQGELTEFFLEDRNFSVFNEGSFETYANTIEDITDSVVSGDYHFEFFKLNGRYIKTVIVFRKSIIILYKNLTFDLINMFFPHKITKTLVKGMAI